MDADDDAAPPPVVAGSAAAGLLDNAVSLALGGAWKVTAPAWHGVRWAADATGSALRRNSRVVHRMAQGQPGSRVRVIDQLVEDVLRP